ncbi:MAG: methylenetetrahydrofolate--tRNA-(uracil(54)-C(5))-methyltransferase (FADH(2)-oxidizing) TrmFO [Anaerolineaceae bacterium]|nr:methylenetetrahydrofolate--tRNA-(uracil(54)-C(5))-methyltransferase (FADH(2)-oxidizing) TrmFO [Anaerolineaceae bacterium]
MTELIVIGGGLAGSESAWQAAERGIDVKLFEMRPLKSTGAHVSADLAELVCSNSLGSNLIDRAAGLLKEEIRRLGSMLLSCAEQTAIPAGGALAVDREAFAAKVTQCISTHPHIQVIREEVNDIPNAPALIASGPLTSANLTRSIQALSEQDSLFFYDAIAPIISFDSINMDIAFRASRFGQGNLDEGDYINCPLNRPQYFKFVDALKNAERIQLRDFESDIRLGVRAGQSEFFEGCLPVEILAGRDPQALAFGPMRPVGLKDPRTGRWPFAIVQLRQDNLAGSLYNMVGFQTNLIYAEQKRIFQMIPGLEKADFVRYGQMHRNTFIASPRLLKPTLQSREYPDLFFAGQIVGVEGYMGNIATGLLAGINAAHKLQDKRLVELSPLTMLGALCRYITEADLNDFQPMKANYGILPPLGVIIKSKREKALAYSQRALAELDKTLNSGLVAIKTPK